MVQMQFKNPIFIKSAANPKGYPKLKNASGDPFVEVAVVGRSNVGKSSLINHLFNKKSLVKTSSMPGKTQLINFFNIDDSWAFVDLPGYGFAKVSKGMKAQWSRVLGEYLEKREPLKLILLLLDIRRTPSKDDLEFLKWAAFHQKALIVVLTKTDKVNKRDRIKNTEHILETLDTENLHHVHYSVIKGEGKKELQSVIKEAIASELNLEQEEKKAQNDG